MQVGTLNRTQDSFDGAIRTIETAITFFMEKADEIPDPKKSPQYFIFTRSRIDGEPVRVGGLREEVKREAGQPDKKYIKLWLDDPVLPDWMKNLAAFPTDQKGVYRIVT